jgi:hypothetical protein
MSKRKHAKPQRPRERVGDQPQMPPAGVSGIAPPLCFQAYREVATVLVQVTTLAERADSWSKGKRPFRDILAEDLFLALRALRTAPTRDPELDRLLEEILGTFFHAALQYSRDDFLKLAREADLVAQVVAKGGDLEWLEDAIKRAEKRPRQEESSHGLGVKHPVKNEPNASQSGVSGPSGLPPARHSEDFRSVHWYGMDFTFTALQAASVRILWEAWDRGVPDLAQGTILARARGDDDMVQDERLSVLFSQRRKGIRQKHPAWGTMIVPGSTRGSFRLKPRENISKSST